MYDFMEIITGPFIDPKKVLFWGYLIAFVLLARFFPWKRVQSRSRDHLSARFDVIVFVLNSAAIWLVVTALKAPQSEFSTLPELTDRFQSFATRVEVFDSPWVQAGAGFTLLLLSDFAYFCLHVAFHKVPFLWSFHKAHHIPATLNPLTTFRKHPFESFIFVFTLSTAENIFRYAFELAWPPGLPRSLLVVEVSLIAWATIAPFRHSHYPLSFPGWLSKIFISPHQHQIHHSRAADHHDKNFGLIFGLWDFMFGTIYIPREEILTFGIDDNEQPHENETISSFYVGPVIGSFASLRKSAFLQRRSPRKSNI